jgi:hypothetical protein
LVICTNGMFGMDRKNLGLIGINSKVVSFRESPPFGDIVH